VLFASLTSDSKHQPHQLITHEQTNYQINPNSAYPHSAVSNVVIRCNICFQSICISNIAKIWRSY